MRTLSHEEARAFYDRLGARQDTQGFYEGPATAALVENGSFGEARSVLEFGCGTGRLAERLLSGVLPADCRYRALDISATMVRLARKRLADYEERATVERTSGSMAIAASESSFDRFIACYVLDLLCERDIRNLLDEVHRTLEPGGLLCTVCLTNGSTVPARIVGCLWHALFRLSPKLVGGCRALRIEDFLDRSRWAVRYREIVTRFGISSEVLVAACRKGPGAGS